MMSLPIIKEMHGKITDKREAAVSMSVLWDKILHGPLQHNHCMCGKRFCYGAIMSYDHDGGFAVPGFEKPQWFYIHCFECGYDMSITHLGIKVRELDLRSENNIWKDMDVCKDCESFHEFYVDYILDNGDKTLLAHHWCEQDSGETTEKTPACHCFVEKE
jgi:hypothetical protein